MNRDGALDRAVEPVQGEPYVHRCPLHSYKRLIEAAVYIQELGRGFTLLKLAEVAGVPVTRAGVALAFWKDCNVIEVDYHRNYADSATFAEDCMTKHADLAKLCRKRRDARRRGLAIGR